MNILSLDTASARCSVALWLNGKEFTQAVDTAREHAQLILPMIDAVLKEAGVRLADLDVIAFGRGPGSFTGLRIAASVAQGLAYGANLAVVPVSDLRALAEQARRQLAPNLSGFSLACMDARMGEVYWGLFAVERGVTQQPVVAEQVTPAALVRWDLHFTANIAAGLGLAAYPLITQALGLSAADCLDRAEPHALDIARLASQDLASGLQPLAPEAAQPIYLRDQVARVPV
jgi:tRNA threonylcarbamoyladenosine biosynthesis protein TsaB